MTLSTSAIESAARDLEQLRIFWIGCTVRSNFDSLENFSNCLHPQVDFASYVGDEYTVTDVIRNSDSRVLLQLGSRNWFPSSQFERVPPHTQDLHELYVDGKFVGRGRITFGKDSGDSRSSVQREPQRATEFVDPTKKSGGPNFRSVSHKTQKKSVASFGPFGPFTASVPFFTSEVAFANFEKSVDAYTKKQTDRAVKAEAQAVRDKAKQVFENASGKVQQVCDKEGNPLWSDEPLPEDGPSKQVYHTGAQRGTDVKSRVELIPKTAMHAIGNAFAEGAPKYGLHNWLKGFPILSVIQHAIEHIYSFLDRDDSEDHLGHAMWNLAAATHFMKYRPDLDDRAPKPVPIIVLDTVTESSPKTSKLDRPYIHSQREDEMWEEEIQLRNEHEQNLAQEVERLKNENDLLTRSCEQRLKSIRVHEKVLADLQKELKERKDDQRKLKDRLESKQSDFDFVLSQKDEVVRLCDQELKQINELKAKTHIDNQLIMGLRNEIQKLNEELRTQLEKEPTDFKYTELKAHADKLGKQVLEQEALINGLRGDYHSSASAARKRHLEVSNLTDTLTEVRQENYTLMLENDKLKRKIAEFDDTLDDGFADNPELEPVIISETYPSETGDQPTETDDEQQPPMKVESFRWGSPERDNGPEELKSES